MANRVQDLVLRINKGTPLTAAEGDNNLKILRDAINGAFDLMANSLNNDGTLKDGAVSSADKIADGIITAAKLASGAITMPTAHFWEQQASGSDGGDFSSPATRTFNQSNINITGASLAGGVITLPAGTYVVNGYATAYGVDKHQVRLYDQTNAANLLTGSSSYSSNASPAVPTLSIIQGRFTLAAETEIKLLHYCQTNRSTDGLGVAANVGTGEVYAALSVTKEP